MKFAQVARGKTDFCAAHGGGLRCRSKGCYKIAAGSSQLCRMHTIQANANGNSNNVNSGINANVDGVATFGRAAFDVDDDGDEDDDDDDGNT